MSPSNKPAIVIVPGAFHKPNQYSQLHSRLASAGYETTTVTLLSCGPKPIASIDPDIYATRSAIAAHLYANRDVCLVMHSYGGIVGSSACLGFRREDDYAGNGCGVTSLVYLAAFVVDEGVSVSSAQGGKHSPWASPVLPEAQWLAYDQIGYDPREIFYNDCSQEVKDENVAKISYLSLSCGSDEGGKCQYAAWKEIESSYLLCEKDQAIDKAVQEAMVNQEGTKWKRVKRMQSGHSPWLSSPEETVNFVRECAGEKL